MDIPKEFIEMIEQDIERINKQLSSETDDGLWELFREIDGKYHACVKDWHLGMWGSFLQNDGLNFPSLRDNPENLKENLAFMRAKLQTFRFQMNATSTPMPAATSLSVVNNINVTLTFDDVRKQIDDMTALSQSETDEIQEKINELERLLKEKTPKKKKWEKIKPIISFVLDKGADVAIAVLSLIIQNNW